MIVDFSLLSCGFQFGDFVYDMLDLVLDLVLDFSGRACLSLRYAT